MPIPSYSFVALKKLLAVSFSWLFLGLFAGGDVNAGEGGLDWETGFELDLGDIGDICIYFPPGSPWMPPNCNSSVPMPPSMPNPFTLPSSDADGTFTISWGASSGTVTNYTLQRLAQGGSWATVQDSNSTSRSESGLANSTYSYRVRACNTSSCSNYTVTKSIQVARVSGAPGAITFTNLSHPNEKRDIDGNYTINWGAANNSPTRYELYLTIHNGDFLSAPSWTRIYNGAARSFSVSQSDNILGYGYKVRACNATGCGPYTAEDIYTPYIQVVSPPSPISSITGPSTDSDGTYSISWGGSSGFVMDYELQRKTNSGSWSTIQKTAGTGRSENGLAQNIYDYRVRSCNFTCSSWSAIKTVNVLLPPVPPSNLTFSNQSHVSQGADVDGSFNVNWSGVSGSVSRYELYQSSNGVTSWTKIYTGTALTKAVSNGNGRYYYYAVACNSAGCSTPSPVKNIQVIKAPSTPSSISVPSSDADGAYNVSWGASSGATKYTLQRKVSGGSWSTVQDSAVTSRAETGLVRGTYQYQVRACGALSCSSWSATKSIQVIHVPGSPGSISFSNLSHPDEKRDEDGNYTINWGVATNSPSRYELYLTIANGDFLSAPIFTKIYDGSSRSFSVSQAENILGYGYKVRACNVSGCGPYSSGDYEAAYVQVATLPGPPEPTGINVVKGTKYGEVTTSWSSPSGFIPNSTKFELQRSYEGGAWQTTITRELLNHEYGLYEGNYAYRVRVCNTADTLGCSDWSSVNLTIEPNATSETTALTPSTLSFQRSVDRAGALRLSMPFKLHTGINGLIPDLSLVNTSARYPSYSFDNPAPIAGSWSLQGLSPISTCDLPPAYERTGKELLFCYMGQNLVPVIKGQQGEGASFRLRKNSDVLFKLYRNGSGHLVFSMHKGDRKTVLGNTDNSRLKLVDQYPYGENYDPDGDGLDKVMWYPSTIEDSFGNTVNINYQKDVDSPGGLGLFETLYPVSFEYDNSRVELAYAFRADTLIKDTRKITSRQLKSIRNVSNNIPVSIYELDYGIKKEVSVLSSIKYCGYDQSGSHKTCGQPTTFDHVNFTHVAQVVDGVLQSVPSSTQKAHFGISEINNGMGGITKFSYEDEDLRRAREKAQGYTDYDDDPQLPPLNVNCVFDGVCGGAMQLIVEENSNGIGGFNRTEYAYPFVWSQINRTYRKKLPDGTYEYHDFNRSSEQDGLPSKKERYLTPRSENGDSVLLNKEERRWSSLANYANPNIIIDGAEKVFYKSYLQQQVKYIVDNGNIVGRVVTQNEPDWDMSKGLINAMTSTTYTGYGYQEDGYLTTVDEFSNLEHKTITNTTYDNNTTDWSIGFVQSNVTQFIDPNNAANNHESTVGNRRAKPSSLKSDRTNKTGLYGQYGTYKSLTETVQYDSKGNAISSTTSGTDIASRTTEAIEFIDNRYPRYQLNAEGHLVEFEYDLRFGLPTRKIDSNQLETIYEYDDFGNLIKETLPNGTVITSDTVFCDFTCPTIQGINGSITPKYKTVKTTANPYEVNKGAPTITVYYDVLGRELRTETEGFAGENLKLDTVYDELGRVAKKSSPYVSGAPIFTTFEYDVYDRPIVVLNADGSRVDYIYEQLSDRRRVTKTTSIAGPLGGKSYTRVEEYNSLNQLIVSYDAYGTADEVKTEYRYDAKGNNTWVRVNEDDNTIVQTLFDSDGNMIGLSDPNAGDIIYDYDVLGQVVSQTDARGIVTKFYYDLLGRMTSRIDDYQGANQVLNEWSYDGQYQGALDFKKRPGFTENYSYDGLVQTNQIDTSISLNNFTGSFQSTITHDNYGRVLTQNYPSGLSVLNSYNSFGFANEVRKISNGDDKLIYRIDGMDNHGNISDTSWGNNVSSQRVVNPITGNIEKITTDGGRIQNLELDWWSDGTVYQRRQLGANSSTETFSYDNLKRLKTSSSVGASSRSLGYTYDPLGNIKSKTDSVGNNDVTAYNYTGDNTPHRLNSVNIHGTSHSLHYDNSGNIIFDDAAGTDNDRHIKYNAFGKPYSITKGAESNPIAKLQFEYGPDTSRFYQENQRGDKTVYLYNGVYEVVMPSSGTVARIEKTYLSGAIHFRDISIYNTQSERLEFTHTDHLGSINAVTDESGELVHAKAFDPYGGYRDVAWTTLVPPPSWVEQATHTSRGFTGHEQLDDVGLIHMNGRVYDPTLGRFISPDVVVQAPHFSQSYNRYAYVWNNPVSMIDPTGFWGESICDHSYFCSSTGENGDSSEKNKKREKEPKLNGNEKNNKSVKTEKEKKEDAKANTSRAELTEDGKWVQGYDKNGDETIKQRYPGGNSDAAGVDGGGVDGRSSIQLNYSDGMEKIEEAANKYEVTDMFKDQLPEGMHPVSLKFDKELSGSVTWFQNPTAGKILVNPDVMLKSSNFIAWTLGHELVHVNDHLRGALNVNDIISVNASERNAWNWSAVNAGHFGLGMRMKIYARERVNDYQ
ncbi:MAG: RHS repeat-associated core domain-containing protein [Cellvibrionaceae bacterium]